MSGTISLSGQLPNDEAHNGLLGWAEQLVQEGGDARLFALVVFDVPTIKIHTDDGSSMPIVRLRHIEPIGWLAEAPKHLVDLMARLGVDRSGGEPLPGVDATADDNPDGLEVYATGPEDDPARGEKLKRAKLTPVPSPFASDAKAE